MEQPQLSIVVPAYNEAESIVPLVEEIINTLQPALPYEILIIDDGSTDNTAARLSALKACYPQLRIIHHQKNSGQSSAILTGVSFAHAEWIATLDGDGQNDPADIPKLLAARDSIADRKQLMMIVGLRQKRRDTWLRRVSSKIANGVRSRLLHDQTPDTGCGLKLFTREAFLSIPHFNHMHRFLPALVQRNGGKVINVPVNHRPRTAGVSKYGLFDRLWVGIVDMAGVLWLQRRPCNVNAQEVL
ncbi:MAG: glycosyltransferase family 2 protein [Gammaproteobacteria bacterium]|nr:glycosyltransferase family 2 protein [Gammaproteobacteria bacterium]